MRRFRVKYRRAKKHSYLIRDSHGRFRNWENIHRATRDDAAHKALYVPPHRGMGFLGDYRTPAEKKRNAFYFKHHRPLKSRKPSARGLGTGINLVNLQKKIKLRPRW